MFMTKETLEIAIDLSQNKELMDYKIKEMTKDPGHPKHRILISDSINYYNPADVLLKPEDYETIVHLCLMMMKSYAEDAEKKFTEL